MSLYGTKMKTDKRGNKMPDLLDLMVSGNKQRDRFGNRPAVSIHEFYLSGTIESAENYIDWFDTIRHAGENDVIKIYINSYGGDLFTAIQFMRVLTETPATVSVSVEGACMSAATIIFLSGHIFEVSEHSMFMFHNYSGGTFGKGGEMLDQLQHEREWSSKLLYQVYSDFLTDKEIQSMLDNKDLWMDGDQIVERLNKKVKKLEREAKKQAKQLSKALEEVIEE